jgi:hypothetical protein
LRRNAAPRRSLELEKEIEMKRHPASTWLACMALAALVVGCAQFQKASDTATKPFKSTRLIDLGPFADHLMAMVGDVQFGLNRARAAHILPYADGPEIERYRRMWDELQKNLSKMLAYSARVVSVSESPLNGPEQAAELARVIESLRPLEAGSTAAQFGMTDQDIRRTMVTIRYQQSLLDALAAAQPLVDQTAKYLREAIDELKEVQDQVEVVIEKKIVAAHTVPLTYRKTLQQRQSDVIRLLQRLDDFRRGDRNALAAMVNSDAELRTLLPKAAAPSSKQQGKIEAVLTDRLAAIASQQQLLEGMLTAYHTEKKELGQLADISDESLRKAKLAVLLWARAHRRLANGITQPGSLDVFHLMNRAVDKAL